MTALPRFDWRVREGTILTALADSAPGRFGVVTSSGWRQEVTNNITTGLREKLGNSTISWASSADANAGVSPADTPLAVGFDSAGDIVEMVYAGEGVIGGLSDAEHDERFKAIAPFAKIVGNPVPGPGRVNAAQVYSRNAGAVFLVGGKGTNGGEEGEVWVYDLFSRIWRRVGEDIMLEGVLSATWLYETRDIVFLDWDSEDAVVRLGRVSPDYDNPAVVHEQDTKSLVFEQKWLIADASGRANLVCSSHVAEKAMVVALDEKLMPTRLWLGKDGELVAPPVADEAGVLLSVSAGEVNRPPRMIRLSELSNPATLEDLYECLR